eukprot:Pgem_evm1s20218
MSVSNKNDQAEPLGEDLYSSINKAWCEHEFNKEALCDETLTNFMLIEWNHIPTTTCIKNTHAFLQKILAEKGMKPIVDKNYPKYEDLLEKISKPKLQTKESFIFTKQQVTEIWQTLDDQFTRTHNVYFLRAHVLLILQIVLGIGVDDAHVLLDKDVEFVQDSGKLTLKITTSNSSEQVYLLQCVCDGQHDAICEVCLVKTYYDLIPQKGKGNYFLRNVKKDKKSFSVLHWGLRGDGGIYKNLTFCNSLLENPLLDSKLSSKANRSAAIMLNDEKIQNVTHHKSPNVPKLYNIAPNQQYFPFQHNNKPLDIIHSADKKENITPSPKFYCSNDYQLQQFKGQPLSFPQLYPSITHQQTIDQQNHQTPETK